MHKRKSRLPRRIAITMVALVLLVVAGVFMVRHIYNQDLKPVSSDQSTQIVVIDSGATTKEIAQLLASKQLIRSAWAFELYVHSREFVTQLQAGTYALSPSSSMPTIITTLSKGKVTTNLVTILPGQRLDQVRATLINDGFSPTSVDAALNASNYSDLAVLSYKPATASLEGLLYPDSFQRTATTDPAVIIRESLTEMGQQLTPTVQAAFAQEGLSVYQGLILASMVEEEVSKPQDRSQVAQVFLSRLHGGSTLGSDVTAYYGAIIAGKNPSTGYDSPYNTLLHSGLPPTPISTISSSSLQAVAHPAATNWLYFVSGDDGNTYFSTNLQDHEALTQKYCRKLCSQ